MSVNYGLKGIVALESSISRIDSTNGILEYRGYNIHDLAKNSSFEEVTFLLLWEKTDMANKLRKVAGL